MVADEVSLFAGQTVKTTASLPRRHIEDHVRKPPNPENEKPQVTDHLRNALALP
jgi:hypothetical protein